MDLFRTSKIGFTVRQPRHSRQEESCRRVAWYVSGCQHVTCRLDLDARDAEAKEASKAAAAAKEKLQDVEREAASTAASLKV